MGRKKSKQKRSGGKKFKQQLTEKIIQLFKKSGRKQMNYKQVSGQIGITDSPTRKLVREILHQLVVAEALEEVERDKFRSAFVADIEVMGMVESIRSGGAYVVTDSSDQDIYIAPRNMNNALHGDLVKVGLFNKGRRRRPEGEVLEVFEREKRSFVGSVELSKKFAFFKPDNPLIKVDIFIPLSEINGAKQGQKAIAQITEWPSGASSPSGKITEVLGEPGKTNTEMHAILAEFGLPRSFPKRVEEAAGRIPLELDNKEISQRRDMRDTTTFTIDPADAKDFDDALSFKKLKNGNYEIGIHIADVSYYVRPDDLVDQEAVKRATSVYLVDRVVPMLPEVLSNKVCSLRPHEDKFTFSAVFEMDDKAQVLREWFGRTVIHSDRRFTYEDAQQVIETCKGDMQEEILTLDKLAKVLRKRRLDKGSIEFSSSEVRFELDKEGNPLRVFKKVMKDSNQLIEDFMLLANRRVAAFIGDPKNAKTGSPKNNGEEKSTQSGKPKTFVYRIHDKPNHEKLEVLARFMQQFDYKLRINSNDIQGELNKMIDTFRDSNERQMIEQVAIRSMAKAVYSIDNIGHYGLGFEYYTHFTSPIRRYPDLVVHRLLQDYLDQKPSADAGPLERTCKHSSIQEKRAADAERTSIKFMQVLFMMDKIGDTFQATITGVTEWGFYASIDENSCEGMVSMKSLDDDFYYFDEANIRIVGRSFGHTFRLGDTVMVKVLSANLERKQLDFAVDFEAENDGDK